MKDNSYKKRTWIDHCCMRYWCQHSRVNYIRYMKKVSRREIRRNNKMLCKNNNEDGDFI